MGAALALSYCVLRPLTVCRRLVLLRPAHDMLCNLPSARCSPCLITVPVLSRCQRDRERRIGSYRAVCDDCDGRAGHSGGPWCH